MTGPDTHRSDLDAGADAASPLPERDVLTVDPPNAEARLHSLRAPVTPLSRFYVRSNFSVPPIDVEAWRLEISGAVAHPLSFSLNDLRALGETTQVVTLECAGNGRTFLSPPVPGTAWTLGGTATGQFTGVPLHHVLAHAGVQPNAVEAVFSGADRGDCEGWGEVHFQRALPVADALRAEQGPLLCWQMNGAALLPEHGAPVRLIVPGWYAVASVKWLNAIELVTQPFAGYFQTDRYLYHEPGQPTQPVRHMRVRALLLDPDPEQSGRITADSPPIDVSAGRCRLSGIAWSGEGAVSGVRLSIDGGTTWHEANLTEPAEPGAPMRWHLDWHAMPGSHDVVICARDSAGNEQPLTQRWNELGYGNNCAQRVRLRVTSAG